MNLHAEVVLPMRPSESSDAHDSLDGGVSTPPMRSDPVFRGIECDDALSQAVLPGPGELLLWRFHTGSKPLMEMAVSAGIGTKAKGLTHRYGTSSHRQYVLTRACVAALFGHAFACAPDALRIDLDPAGRMYAFGDRAAPMLIDSAMVGMWLVIAASLAPFGLGAALDASPHAHAPVATPPQNRCRDTAQTRAIEQQRYLQHAVSALHVMDIPMWGAVTASIASTQPVSSVYAFGWTSAR
ncbi:hypothetical protein [Pararobbsia silviterrae]|uniref:Uncharacterized protein n=1 Tax=Pararobbsia silviterrae TaxID=1792498 RepID=A0A494XSJ8_9BURK|nr:hypothetical protein [Pararobbsia silviterrae]RKP53587.1 hypothetical protein D7S86_15020 [Pararobbsia silviterrae]